MGVPSHNANVMGIAKGFWGFPWIMQNGLKLAMLVYLLCKAVAVIQLIHVPVCVP